MNSKMINRLIYIDLYFNRFSLIGLTLVGLIAVALFTIESKSVFYVGLVLLISSIIMVGALLVFTSIIFERKNKTLPFILSLPVSYMNYTIAKMTANLSAFLLIWTLLSGSLILVIFNQDHIPNGLIPYISINLVELMVAYIAMLAVALVSESEVWTISAMSILNVGVSLFMFWTGNLEGIVEHIEGSNVVWTSTALTILTSEILIGLVIIALVFYFQSKKKDFL